MSDFSGTRTFEWLEAERMHGIRESIFSKQACDRMPGKKHLHSKDVSENLFHEIRDGATKFFHTREIQGHGESMWDTSLTSSQVACVNCMYPFVDQPEKLHKVLDGILGDVEEVLPITAETPLDNGSLPFLTFEWIDVKKRLGERGRSVRGRYVTNVDVLFRYRTKDNRIVLVLVEWKYRECYGPSSTRYSSKGTDRLATYLPHFALKDCQIRLPDNLSPAVLMFHPLDQLMRLQLLASILERDSEMEAEKAIVLHIAPRANHELLSTLHSPELAKYFNTNPTLGVHGAWKNLTLQGTFKHFATEDLIPILAQSAPTAGFEEYVTLRYGNIADRTTGVVLKR